MFSVMKNLKEGVGTKLKEKIKVPWHKGLERRKWKSVKSFFSEKIYTTKAFLQGK